MQTTGSRTEFSPWTVLVAVWVLSAGCSPIAPRQTDEFTSASAQPVNVIRQGRYTLVEVGSEPVQQDLLSQIINLTVPANPHTSVGEALNFVLLDSGFRLCEGRAELQALQALPLPAAHVRLGPMTLHDALQTLAGRHWLLQVDEAQRIVCFRSRREEAK